MKIPLQKISDTAIEKYGVNVFVLRLDKMHPDISGNKWFKLKYNLEAARKQKKDTLLTFGGAYSNHIAATAAAGKEFGFKTIGIIRGEELASPLRRSPLEPLRQSTESVFQRTVSPFGQPSPKERKKNHTLKFAESCGMKLHFVSREDYRQIRANEILPERILSQLPIPPSQLYFLPEGGTNELAVKGCSEILSHINISFDYVCCPVGTGGTIAGIISSLKKNQKAIGFSVLKDGEFLKTSKVFKTFEVSSDWNLNLDYHFGGYAKHTPELLKFISDFEKENDIPLEQVYTGKMMFGIYGLIKKNYFQKNSTVIAIHTGGLQSPRPPMESDTRPLRNHRT